MRTRDGLRRSPTAVPSARNSGLDNTSNGVPGRWNFNCLMLVTDDQSGRRCQLTTSYTMRAVRHGTVDFSTITAPGLATRATDLAADSNMEISVAYPAPRPFDFVGVLTERKTISAMAMCLLQSVEKKRFGSLAGNVFPVESVFSLAPSRAMRTISTRHGSWIGRCFDCQPRVRSSFMSTTVTVRFGLQYAITAAVGPPEGMSVTG